MALPGMRGYGRDDGWGGGRNSSYGRKKDGIANNIGANPFGVTRGSTAGGRVAVTDPSVTRRMDGLEQRMGQQDGANRGLMEQLMKMQQDIKMEMKKQEQMIMEERNQRLRLETAVSGAGNKLGEMEERLRRAEDSSKENKNALSQLISHTKNVERAVTTGQQDMIAKREAQGQKIQEIFHKMAGMQQNRETLERTCYNLRDEVRDLGGKTDTLQMEVKDFEGAVQMQTAAMEKIQASRMAQKDGGKEKEGRMTETQRAMLEAKIMQLQQGTLDLAQKVSHEKRERDADIDQVNSRITEVVGDLAERDRQRQGEQREEEAKAREQATLGAAEKQKIIMQISAVQTDIKRTLDERDTQLREVTIHRLEDMENKLAEGEKLHGQADRDLKSLLAAEMEKQQAYCDHSVDGIKKMMENNGENTRGRLQEITDSINEVDASIAEAKSNLLDEIHQVAQDGESREKVLDAKIDDLGDRLRLGMGTLQAAIGEGMQNGNANPDDEEGEGIPLEEVQRLQEEAVEGVREKMAMQVTSLEDNISQMKSDIRRQDEIIASRLKSQQQAGEDSSTILGDKLHQKMDSISFTQERMKRQMDDLQDRIAGAPTDIGDLRDRVEDVERGLAKKADGGGGGGAASEDLDNIRKDLDKILGRDEIGTAEVDGIPTLTRLQTDLDQVNNNVKVLSEGVEQMKTQLTEKLTEEKEAREEETSTLKKDLDRLEKKSKELKERMKGKLGGLPGMPDDSDGEQNKDEEEGNE